MSDFRRDGFLIRDALPAEDDALVALWQCCALTRSWNDPYRDLDRARSEQSTRLLVGAIDRRILASAMIGSDGHRGWLYYLAVTRSVAAAATARA